MDTRNFTFMFYGFAAAWLILVIYVLMLVAREVGSFPGVKDASVVMATEANKALLKKKIVGGLPLGKFYPELADCMLLCATEMSRRADMDVLAQALARGGAVR